MMVHESRANRLKLLAQQVYTVGLDLLFPPHCVGCERVGSFFCSHCRATITPAEERSIRYLDGMVACGEFAGPLRDAIHALKYDGVRRIAADLAALLSGAVDDSWLVDVIVPVPLHTSRKNERGYNQAELIAQELGTVIGARVDANSLQRVRATESQVGLTAGERLRNVEDAFAVRSGALAGRGVLLLDDVLTTGATLTACAKALRDAGVATVYGAAVAGAVYAPA